MLLFIDLRLFPELTWKGQHSGRCLEAIIKLPDTSEIIAHIYCGLATNLFLGHFSSHLNFGNKDKNPEGIIKILWAAKQMLQVM